MEGREKPSMVMRWSAPALFIAMTAGALFWFLLASIDVVGQVLAKPESLSFDKGAFYLLGVGVALAVLSFVLVHEFWFGKTLSGWLSRTLTNIAVAAVIAMVALPHATHYAVDSYLADRGYTICEGASRQWLHSRTIVFVETGAVCQQLVKERQYGKK